MDTSNSPHRPSPGLEPSIMAAMSSRAPEPDADHDGWTEADARLAAGAACRQVEVDGELTLLRWSANGVYRCGDRVVKVYRTSDSTVRMRQAARAARLCAAAGAPIAAPDFAGELFAHHGGVVGFWPYIEPVRDPDWDDLGTLLRKLHDTGEALVGHAPVPAWPGVIGARWATGPYRRAADADPAAADAIDAAALRLTDRCSRLSVTRATMLHGDASLANTIVGADGPVLIDTDWMSVGPAAVDVADVVHERRHGDLDAPAYRDFVAAYGSDLSDHPEMDLAVAVRALHGVVYRIAESIRAGTDIRWVADEAARWA